MTTPSGRISNEPEEREREKERKREKMPFIVATYVYASSQGQRTDSARTNVSNSQPMSNLDLTFLSLVKRLCTPAHAELCLLPIG